MTQLLKPITHDALRGPWLMHQTNYWRGSRLYSKISSTCFWPVLVEKSQQNNHGIILIPCTQRVENAPIARAAIHCFNCSNLVGSEWILFKIFHPMVWSYHGLMWCYNHIKCDQDDMIISLTVIYVNCCTYVHSVISFFSFIKQSLIIMMWSYQYDDVLIIIFDYFLMTNEPLGGSSSATQLWNDHILFNDIVI